MKKTRLKDYVYDCSTDYDYIPVSDILDIDKYLMEKNKIVKSLYFILLVLKQVNVVVVVIVLMIPMQNYVFLT